MTRSDQQVIKHELTKIRGMVSEIRIGRSPESIEEYINKVLAGYERI